MGENFDYDFRTPLQKQNDERRKRIASMFVDYRKKADANVSNNRIMTVIAKELDCTTQNIRNILMKEGLIIKRKQHRNKKNV